MDSAIIEFSERHDAELVLSVVEMRKTLRTCADHNVVLFALCYRPLKIPRCTHALFLQIPQNEHTVARSVCRLLCAISETTGPIL